MEKIEGELENSPLRESTIISFQEIISKNGQVEYLAKKYGYYYYYKGRNGVLSKYPITKSGFVIVNQDTDRKAIWVDLLIESSQPIRIYIPHLSYKIKINPFIADIRGKEMNQILEHTEAFDGPIIIAGDLNTIGFLFFGHSREPAILYAKRAGFVDAMKDIKYSSQRFVGRVDWILARGFKILTSTQGNYGGSDHRWIQSTLEIVNDP